MAQGWVGLLNRVGWRLGRPWGVWFWVDWVPSKPSKDAQIAVLGCFGAKLITREECRVWVTRTADYAQDEVSRILETA